VDIVQHESAAAQPDAFIGLTEGGLIVPWQWVLTEAAAGARLQTNSAHAPLGMR